VWCERAHSAAYDLQFASDAYYAAPVTLSARLHSTAGSFTYMYVNNYNISTGALSQSMHWLPYWMGVCHECDLYLLFGMPWAPTHLLPVDVRNATWTLPDRNASELFMTLWQRFASDKWVLLAMRELCKNIQESKHPSRRTEHDLAEHEHT
jgi:hypothetical protein